MIEISLGTQVSSLCIPRGSRTRIRSDFEGQSCMGPEFVATTNSSSPMKSTGTDCLDATYDYKYPRKMSTASYFYAKGFAISKG